MGAVRILQGPVPIRSIQKRTTKILLLDGLSAFLDEMRQQFMQTQNVNVIPQSLMYRQTQLMESQVQMLEQNQKQMGEVINNVMNQQATGHESGASLKQNIFNENRRMMLEMMVMSVLCFRRTEDDLLMVDAYLPR